jgi:transcriptional regulator with XRE-family HTH domain
MLPEVDKFYQEIGERIKTERLKKRLSQEDLGVRLGLTRASIVNLEKGRHRPSIFQLIQIAKAFEMDYTLLIPYNSSDVAINTSVEVDYDKIVIDQDKLDKSTRTAVMDILSKINK